LVRGGYPTPVKRHIGVEAFSERPAELGERVEWQQRSLGDLAPVGDGEVDLVFAGQVIEHLWPEDVVGFLLESHRVIRPGGTIALDSPNRRVTTAIGWEHPEHTVEFRPDEILELLRLAGFDQAQARGVYLCFERDRNRFFTLEGGSRTWSPERRAAEAAERPDDSFVWWVEAVRGDREPDADQLSHRVETIYNGYRRQRFGSLKHSVGTLTGLGQDPGGSCRGGGGRPSDLRALRSNANRGAGSLVSISRRDPVTRSVPWADWMWRPVRRLR
jgi:SAM-dependent methyltransferase